MRRADRRSALRLYLFSLAYLAALFAAMVVDAKLEGTTPRLMDRRLARKNIRTSLIAGAVCFVMFGMTFVAAVIYVVMSELEPAAAPPAGEEIHLPGPSLQPLLLTVGVTMLAHRRDEQHVPAHRRRDPHGRDARPSGSATPVARSTHLPSEHHH